MYIISPTLLYAVNVFSRPY